MIQEATMKGARRTKIAYAEFCETDIEGLSYRPNLLDRPNTVHSKWLILEGLDDMDGDFRPSEKIKRFTATAELQLLGSAKIQLTRMETCLYLFGIG